MQKEIQIFRYYESIYRPNKIALKKRQKIGRQRRPTCMSIGETENARRRNAGPNNVTSY